MITAGTDPGRPQCLTRIASCSGPFAPVEEEITAFDLPVTGSLPAGLNGRYLRNGPNPLGLDDPGYRFWEGHWFLGPGMVHGVRLRDGKAEWYRNRWVRSQALAEAMDETWPAGPVHDDMDFAANTHIIAHAGRYLATVEAGPLPYELSGELDIARPVRLCRHAARRVRRPHQARPRDGRAARDRLLLGLGPRPARDHRRRRHGQPHHRHPGRPTAR